MITDHEKAKNIAAMFQSLVVGFAVIVGGGWSGWEFYKLKVIEKAKAELKTLQNEIDQKAVVNVTLEANTKLKSEGYSYLEINVNLSNVGKKDALLDFSKSVISVADVSFDKKGKVRFGEASYSHVKNAVGRITETLVRTGETQKFPVLVRVKGAGIYAIRFKTPISKGDKRKEIDGELWEQQIFTIVSK